MKLTVKEKIEIAAGAIAREAIDHYDKAIKLYPGSIPTSPSGIPLYHTADVEVVWDELARKEPNLIASSFYNESKEYAYKRVLVIVRKKLKAETNRRLREAKLREPKQKKLEGE
jgi:hypothetical protein